MAIRSRQRSIAGAALLTSLLLMSATVMATSRIWSVIGSSSLGSPSVFPTLIVRYEILPRVVICLLVGAALGFAGVIMQRILRNPLAEPTTLGSAAGAQLALVATTLFAPSLLSGHGEWVALAGALAGTTLCFAVSVGTSLSTLSLVLAGLLINLFCSSFAAILTLFHWSYLSDINLWGTGVLVQNDWSVVRYLFPRLASIAICLCLLIRPLNVLALEDANARGLGVSLLAIRLIALGLTILLTAFVVSAVGLVGFIGLAAPAIARMLGANRMRSQMIWATLLGAGLLWMTDEGVQTLAAVSGLSIPTGTAAGLLGAPLLIILVGRTRQITLERTEMPQSAEPKRRPTLAGILILVFLAICLFASLDLGRYGSAWSLDNWNQLQAHLPLRWPRTLTAMAAGGALAAAGAIIQRSTGNPMASPELLGTTSGASFCVILLLLAVPASDRSLQLCAGTIGALVMLVLLLVLGHRSRFAPDRTLLVGMAITTAFGAFISFLVASGDPRLGRLLAWMSGSLYAATPADALIAFSALLFGLSCVPFLRRWLALMPLGATASSALGLNVMRSRLALLLIAAFLSAAATLTIGSISFVGLLAPHMVSTIGFRRPLPHIYASSAVGALIMVAADWLGRNILFPDQVPAGILATLLGVPYFLAVMLRRRRL